MTTAAATVLLGTLYPLMLEAMGGGKVSVGAPFFNATFVPLMVPMLIAMAVGPMLTWKRSDLKPALNRLWIAFAVTAAVLLIVWRLQDGAALGLLGIAVATWLFAGTVVQLADRVRLFGVPLRESARRLVRTPRSAWGMTLAHAGLAVTIAGVTGAGVWKVESIQTMKPGDTVTVADYAYTFKGVEAVPGPNYDAVRATFDVSKNGRFVVTLYPEKRVYPVQNQPTTEAAIYPTLWGDLYAVIGDSSGRDGAFVTRLYFNPLVGWMWAGVMIMVLGGAVSLSDRRYRVGAPKGSRRRLESVASA
jgi:cytochrome c-type biogenesis protein CcmF